MLDTFRKHPYLASAFALTSALALFFAIRIAIDVIYWSAHENEPVRPWMTVGYVAKSWDLNPRVIDETAGLPLPVDGRPFTLQEIATQRGVPVEEIIKQIEAAVAQLTARKQDGQERDGQERGGQEHGGQKP
jgi:hypothetical protein